MMKPLNGRGFTGPSQSLPIPDTLLRGRGLRACAVLRRLRWKENGLTRVKLSRIYKRPFASRPSGPVKDADRALWISLGRSQ